MLSEGARDALDEARRAVERALEGDALADALARARGAVEGDGTSEALVRARIHFGRTLRLLGERRAAEARPEAAAAARREAATWLLRASEEADRERLPRWRAFALVEGVELYLAAGRAAEAHALAEAALRSANATGDPDALARAQTGRARAARRLGRADEAVEAYRAARRQLDRLRARLDVDRFLERAEAVHRPLADLLLRRAETVEGDAHQALLEEVLDALEALRVAELRDYFQDSCLAEQVATRAERVPGAVVLRPVLLDDRVELLVGHDGRLSRRASPAAAEALRSESERLRRWIADPTTNRYRRPAGRLYDGLVRPIEDLLVEPGRVLVLVPSGPLFEVPIAALRDDRSGRFLVEWIPTAVTPGVQLTDPRPIQREDARALIVGLSQPVAPYEALPHVRSELAAVEASFPGTLLVDDAFTAEGFEQRFDRAPFGIVHIATHGVFDGDAQESFLLTSGGRLSLERLASIIARARFRGERPLDLLTLSACETAVGDGRAALGLAGVAVRSGARSALGSLWRVSDQATARLIRSFYRELAKPGVSRARALQTAQLEQLGDVASAHPYYWASFLLISSWL